jgi:GAF domain-containing protein/CHASE1-domain containing sensor protein
MIPGPSLTFARWLAEVAIMALVYCLAGRIALFMAIPPGYATAVWPAAGLALAGVLLRGYRLWPGIVLGSFFVNVWTSWEVTSGLAILKSLALPTTIGAGAALQAVAAACLVRRLVGSGTLLANEREILTLLVAGGPVGCLVSASVGVTSLAVWGAIRWDEYLFSWWTWWVGDTIGVLIFTPLVLIWTATPRSAWRRRALAVSVPLCLSLGFVVALFVMTSRSEQARARRDFERRTADVAHALARTFDGYLEALRAMRAYFDSSPRTDRRGFRSFVAGWLARQPGIQGLGWIPRLRDADRAAYEEAARREGPADFEVTERQAGGRPVRAQRRAVYFPVSFVEPFEGNETVLGFDVASERGHRAALDQARDTGNPTATGPTLPPRDAGGQTGFLVFMPIYRPGLRSETLEERRRALQGYALGIFRMPDMIEAAMSAVDRGGIGLALYDETDGERARLLFATGRPTREAPGPAWRTTIPVEVAGRRWVLLGSLTREYLVAHPAWQAWGVLAAGMLFSGLLGALLLVLTARAATVEALVVQRTAALHEANAELRREVAEREQAEQALREAQAELVGNEERARQQAAQMEALVQASVALTTDLSLDRVLQGIAEVAGVVLGARYAALGVLNEDGTALSRVVTAGVDEATKAAIGRLPTGKGILGVLIKDRRPVRLRLVSSHPQAAGFPPHHPPMRSFLGVPITVREEAYGNLYVTDKEGAEEFSETDERVALMLAAHAGIAIQNARLFEEGERRRRAAEGLAELGRVISQSHDPREVEQRIVDSVRRLFDAQASALFRLEPESRDLVAVATSGDVGPAFAVRPVFAWGTGVSGLAARERRPVVTPDVLADPRFTFTPESRAAIEAAGYRAVLAVPLLVKDRVIGTLAVGGRAGRAFEQEEVRLAQAFADEAALALENARLYESVEVRATRLHALARLNRLVSSSLDIGEVLRGIARAAAELMAARLVAFWVADQATQSLELCALSDERIGDDFPLKTLRFGQGIVGWVALHRHPLDVPDIAADQRGVASHWFLARGLRSSFTFPIAFQDSLLGVLVLAGRRPFRLGPDDRELLDSFMDQAAVAIRNARAFEALREAQEELVRAERLALLGRLAGGVGHELRNPLGVIQNSVYYLKTVLPDGEAVRKHLAILEREVRTADRIVNDLLDFARTRLPTRVPHDLNDSVREVLERTPRPENVRVVLHLSEDLPAVLADPHQVGQVLGNLVTNAIQAMPEGGTLTVETAQAGGDVQVAVADTGLGIPPENLEKIFQPLFTTKARGIGLGLAVAKTLAEASGGAITVESIPGRGSRFVVRFPEPGG